MMLTQENAEQYAGKYVSRQNAVFHYYPLKVVRQKTGYHVIDRHDTMMRIPESKEGGIFFEYVEVPDDEQ